MPIPRNFFPNSLGAEVGEVQLVDCVLFKSHCGLAASGSAIVNMERGMIYDVMVGGELGRPVLLSLLQDSLARSSIKHLRDELSMSYRHATARQGGTRHREAHRSSWQHGGAQGRPGQGAHGVRGKRQGARRPPRP